MGLNDRRERERQQARQAIIDAAREAFLEKGFTEAGLREIARRAEYSPAALYVHFKDKEDLFHQICLQDFAAFDAEFPSLNKIEDPAKRIAAAGRAYIRFAASHPKQYRMMFMRPGDPNTPVPPPPPDWDNPDCYGHALLHHACEELVSQKRVATGLRNAELLTQTFWAAVHGVAALEVVKTGHPWVQWCELEQRIAAMVDGILAGLVDVDRKVRRK